MANTNEKAEVLSLKLYKKNGHYMANFIAGCGREGRDIMHPDMECGLWTDSDGITETEAKQIFDILGRHITRSTDKYNDMPQATKEFSFS